VIFDPTENKIKTNLTKIMESDKESDYSNSQTEHSTDQNISEGPKDSFEEQKEPEKQ